MKNSHYRIGISCVGSGIGQSIVNSLNLSSIPMHLIGLGNNPFAYGAYDCDEFDYTPEVHSDNYIDELIKACSKHGIDLIIPGFDTELILLARNYKKFEKAGIKIILSSEGLISKLRDKNRMLDEFKPVSDAFVRFHDRSSLKIEIEKGKIKFPLLAKPFDGSGSTGIIILNNIHDLQKISERHIVQEIAFPKQNDQDYEIFCEKISKNQNLQVSEVSIQVVTGAKGEMLGRMATYNKLKDGVPIEIIPIDNTEIWSVVDELLPILIQLGLRGPLNIQGRLTDDGLKIFEMNPRFTGISGLRALMGFNEVEACVKEWLGIDNGKNQIRINSNRFGTRQTADKSIPIESNQKIKNIALKLNKARRGEKKAVLITGASGYLGQNLIFELIRDESFDIWAFSRNKSKIEDLFIGKVKRIFDKHDLSMGRIPFGHVDVLLHLGFARPFKGNQEIADSLEFTFNLFSSAVALQVPAIVNISSQSVYGLNTPPLWKESMSVEPSTPYAQAKHAAELFLESLHKYNKQFRFTSLRMARLHGGANGLKPVDAISKFVLQALTLHPITIYGGQQEFELLDIRDAVGAIMVLLKSDSKKWKTIYNFGSGEIHNLMSIANRIVHCVALMNGGKKTQILVESNDITTRFGMDSSCFYNDFSWRPIRNIDDTIISLIDFLKNQKLFKRIQSLDREQ